MDKRRAERHAVVLDGECLTGRGLSAPAHINNVSAEGCEVTDVIRLLEIGEELRIKLGKRNGLRCIVRWRQGSRVGLEFTHPLHPAILDFLLKEVGATAVADRAKAAEATAPMPLSQRFASPQPSRKPVRMLM